MYSQLSWLTGQAGLGPPERGGDHAGFHQLQTFEEAGDLLGSTHDVLVAGFVCRTFRLEMLLSGLGAIVDHDVAAGGYGIHQPLYDRTRLVGVGDVAED